MLRVFIIAFVVAHHLQQFQLICLNILSMLRVLHIVFIIAHHLQQFHLIYLDIVSMLRIFMLVLIIVEILHCQHQYSIFKHYKKNSRIWHTVSEHLPQYIVPQAQFSQFGITLQLQLVTSVSETAQP